MTDFLTKAEESRMQKLEGVIEEGLKSFFVVGSALLEIRDGRLYREDHPTFDDYCQDKWDLKHTQVYRLMDATRIRRELEEEGIEALPKHERQVRPLSKIKNKQERVRTYKAALKMSPAGEVSPPAGPIVERAVQATLPKPKPDPKPHKHQCPDPDCGIWHAPPKSYWDTKKQETQQARPKQAQQRSVQSDLESYFSKLSNIPMPNPTNERDRKAAAVRWWQPLKEIAELAQWSEREGEHLIADAFKHLRSNGILLEAPQSIIKTVRALAAGQTPGKQSGLDILKNDFQQNEAEMEEARHGS